MANRDRRKNWGGYGRTIVGLLVATVFLYLAFARVDLPELRRTLRGLHLWPLGVAVVFIGIDYFARIVRWWWMLRRFRPGLTIGRTAGPLLAGFGANAVLPLRLGDLIRAIGFRGQLQTPAMHVVATLVLERLLDLLSLLLVLLAGVAAMTDRHPGPFLPAVLWLSAACLAATAVLLLSPGLCQRCVRHLLGIRWLARWGGADRVARWSDQFFETLIGLRDIKTLLVLGGLSLVAWLLEGAAFACVAVSLDIAADSLAPWFAMAAGTLGTMIPSTPGYVGTFDYFTILGLTAYGHPKTIAAAFALVAHAMIWFPIAIAGGSYLVGVWGLGAAGQLRRLKRSRDELFHDQS